MRAPAAKKSACAALISVGSSSSNRADHSESDRSWPRASSWVENPPSRTMTSPAASASTRDRARVGGLAEDMPRVCRGLAAPRAGAVGARLELARRPRSTPAQRDEPIQRRSTTSAPRSRGCRSPMYITEECYCGQRRGSCTTQRGQAFQRLPPGEDVERPRVCTDKSTALASMPRRQK